MIIGLRNLGAGEKLSPSLIFPSTSILIILLSSLIMNNINPYICSSWADQDDLVKEYHDHRWCKPCHEDNELFAMLCLEGQQAGLSWTTIIHKESAIREAFDNFIISKVANYNETKIEDLMQNKDIIRNRLKISSAIKNAKAIIALIASGEYKSFDEYIWHFTDNQRVIHHFNSLYDIPAKDELSEKISKDLKKRGFSFVGPVIIYSYLQGIGIYDDHLDNCPAKSKLL